MSIDRKIEGMYLHRFDVQEYEKRGKQINVSVSIDTYAMLKALSDHFRDSLSGFADDILSEQVGEILRKIADYDDGDAQSLFQKASDIVKEEAAKLGDDDPWSRWNPKGNAMLAERYGDEGVPAPRKVKK